MFGVRLIKCKGGGGGGGGGGNGGDEKSVSKSNGDGEFNDIAGDVEVEVCEGTDFGGLWEELFPLSAMWVDSEYLIELNSSTPSHST